MAIEYKHIKSKKELLRRAEKTIRERCIKRWGFEWDKIKEYEKGGMTWKKK